MNQFEIDVKNRVIEKLAGLNQALKYRNALLKQTGKMPTVKTVYSLANPSVSRSEGDIFRSRRMRGLQVKGEQVEKALASGDLAKALSYMDNSMDDLQSIYRQAFKANKISQKEYDLFDKFYDNKMSPLKSKIEQGHDIKDLNNLKNYIKVFSNRHSQFLEPGLGAEVRTGLHKKILKPGLDNHSTLKIQVNDYLNPESRKYIKPLLNAPATDANYKLFAHPGQLTAKEKVESVAGQLVNKANRLATEELAGFEKKTVPKIKELTEGVALTPEDIKKTHGYTLKNIINNMGGADNVLYRGGDTGRGMAMDKDNPGLEAFNVRSTKTSPAGTGLSGNAFTDLYASNDPLIYSSAVPQKALHYALNMQNDRYKIVPFGLINRQVTDQAAREAAKANAAARGLEYDPQVIEDILKTHGHFGTDSMDLRKISDLFKKSRETGKSVEELANDIIYGGNWRSATDPSFSSFYETVRPASSLNAPGAMTRGTLVSKNKLNKDTFGDVYTKEINPGSAENVYTKQFQNIINENPDDFLWFPAESFNEKIEQILTDKKNKLNFNEEAYKLYENISQRRSPSDRPAEKVEDLLHALEDIHEYYGNDHNYDEIKHILNDFVNRSLRDNHQEKMRKIRSYAYDLNDAMRARQFLNESGKLQDFDPNVYDIVNRYSNIER